MNWNRRMVVAGLLAHCLVAFPVAESWSMVEGRGAGGEPYATGGVGDDERAALTKRRQEFNVWITTAAKQSGVLEQVSYVWTLSISGDLHPRTRNNHTA